MVGWFLIIRQFHVNGVSESHAWFTNTYEKRCVYMRDINHLCDECSIAFFMTSQNILLVYTQKLSQTFAFTKNQTEFVRFPRITIDFLSFFVCFANAFSYESFRQFLSVYIYNNFFSLPVCYYERYIILITNAI